MKQRIRIKVEGGVVHTVHLPEGVELEVIDYDVEGDDPEESDVYQGEPCRHWVEGGDGAAKDCEYDSDDGWRAWLAGQSGADCKGGDQT